MPKRIAYKKSHKRRPTRIKALREARGLSQDALGEMIETSGASISRIETGEQPYHQDTLEAIAVALGTDAATLLKEQPDYVTDLMSILARAKPTDVQKLIDIARTLIGEPDIGAISNENQQTGSTKRSRRIDAGSRPDK